MILLGTAGVCAAAETPTTDRQSFVVHVPPKLKVSQKATARGMQYRVESNIDLLVRIADSAAEAQRRESSQPEKKVIAGRQTTFVFGSVGESPRNYYVLTVIPLD